MNKRKIVALVLLAGVMLQVATHGTAVANGWREIPPSISVTAVVQKGSPQIHPAPGARVQVLRADNGRVVQQGKADGRGKILFNSLPEGVPVVVKVIVNGKSAVRGPFPNRKGDKRRQTIPVRLY